MQMSKDFNLKEWATKISSEDSKDRAKLTSDCDAHPLWILVSNCLFKQREGASFTEDEIYQTAEQFCYDEYSSRAPFKDKERYVHVDALRPIKEAIPKIYLDLLLSSEKSDDLPRRYYFSLYPHIQKGVRCMGKPEPGFQIVLMDIANEAHGKVSRLLATVDAAPLMRDKEMKKTYSLLIRAVTCFKFRTTCTNFDTVRSKLISLASLSFKTKHPTQKIKEEFRSWKAKVDKELEIR